jgi:hypothetical protein
MQNTAVVALDKVIRPPLLVRPLPAAAAAVTGTISLDDRRICICELPFMFSVIKTGGQETAKELHTTNCEWIRTCSLLGRLSLVPGRNLNR